MGLRHQEKKRGGGAPEPLQALGADVSRGRAGQAAGLAAGSEPLDLSREATRLKYQSDGGMVDE